MFRKFTTNILILLVAAIPLAITLTNYKLNYDPSVADKFHDPKILISDIATQMTFLSISVCIIALSDYWDFRSDDRPNQNKHSMQRFEKIQYAIVFMLSTVILFDFILYYAEILAVTVVDFRSKNIPPEQRDTLLSSFAFSAGKFLVLSGILLLSSILLYGAYFLTQTEQKLMARMFWSYAR